MCPVKLITGVNGAVMFVHCLMISVPTKSNSNKKKNGKSLISASCCLFTMLAPIHDEDATKLGFRIDSRQHNNKRNGARNAPKIALFCLVSFINNF